MYYNSYRDPRIDLLSSNQLGKYYSPQRYQNLYTSNIFQHPPKQYLLPQYLEKKYKKQSPIRQIQSTHQPYPSPHKQLSPYINKRLAKNDLGWDGVKLVQYVTNSLDKQQYLKDSAVIQKFRLEAQERKKKKRHYQIQPERSYKTNSYRHGSIETINHNRLKEHKQTISVVQQPLNEKNRVENSQYEQQQYQVMIPCRDRAINTSQIQVKLPKSQRKQSFKIKNLKRKYSGLKNKYKELMVLQNQLEQTNRFGKMEWLLKQVQQAIQANKDLTKSRLKTEPVQHTRYQSIQKIPSKTIIPTKQDQKQQAFSTISNNQYQEQNNHQPLSKPLVVYSPQVKKMKTDIQKQRNKISHFLESLKSKRKRIEYSGITS